MASPGHGRRRGTAKARTADAAAARRGTAAPALRRRGRGDGARRGRHRRPRGGLPGVDRPGAGPRPRAGRSGRVGRPREEGGRGQVRKRGSGGPPAVGPATWGTTRAGRACPATPPTSPSPPRGRGGTGWEARGTPAPTGWSRPAAGGGPNGSCDRPREREPRLSCCDRRRMGAGAATFRPAPPGGAGPGTAPSARSPATGAAGRPPGSLEVIAGPVASTTTSGGRGRVRGRPAPARGRDQGYRRGDGRPRHPWGGLPRRVELCHKASRRG